MTTLQKSINQRFNQLNYPSLPFNKKAQLYLEFSESKKDIEDKLNILEGIFLNNDIKKINIEGTSKKIVFDDVYGYSIEEKDPDDVYNSVEILADE